MYVCTSLSWSICHYFWLFVCLSVYLSVCISAVRYLNMDVQDVPSQTPDIFNASHIFLIPFVFQALVFGVFTIYLDNNDKKYGDDDDFESCRCRRCCTFVDRKNVSGGKLPSTDKLRI